MSTKKIKINLQGNQFGDVDIIPKSALNFERFNTNPVLLHNHEHNELPIGLVSEVKSSNKGLMFKPIFHNLTNESKYLNFLHKSGCIVNAYPGGYIERDENGNIKEFMIHEISICTP